MDARSSQGLTKSFHFDCVVVWDSTYRVQESPQAISGVPCSVRMNLRLPQAKPVLTFRTESLWALLLAGPGLPPGGHTWLNDCPLYHFPLFQAKELKALHREATSFTQSHTGRQQNQSLVLRRSHFLLSSSSPIPYLGDSQHLTPHPTCSSLSMVAFPCPANP